MLHGVHVALRNAKFGYGFRMSNYVTIGSLSAQLFLLGTNCTSLCMNPEFSVNGGGNGDVLETGSGLIQPSLCFFL